jgi:hypothetical protein
MLWGTSVPLVADVGLTSNDKGRRFHQNGGCSHTGVNIPWSYPQIVRPFPLLWTTLWISWGRA